MRFAVISPRMKFPVRYWPVLPTDTPNRGAKSSTARNKKSQQCGNNSLRKEIPLNFFFGGWREGAGRRGGGGRENNPACSPFRWEPLPRVIPEGCEIPPNHGAAQGASFSATFSIGSTPWPHRSAL